MPNLRPLQFKPGINRDVTAFSNEGGWYDCDKVRFRKSFPESIGGWSRFMDETFLGTCRSLYTWTILTSEVLLGLGTTLKFYISYGNALYDITPIRRTTSAGAVTFSATTGSTTLTVTDSNHGASRNAFVTFSGAVDLGGDITASILNAEHQVASVVDASTYTITLSTAATASDTGNGGGSVIGAYQINPGLDTGISGTGWGADPWGDGGWGAAGTTSAGDATLRIWSQDNFGEDLVINPRNGGIYYWDVSLGIGSSRAVALSDLSGASDAPTIATQVMVSDQDRHIICFGADPEDDPGNQDPLLIRWSDQENAADWTTRTTNTSGSIRLSRGARIVRAIQTKREIVIFTDQSMHSMQFLGPPYTFGIQEISSSTELMSPISVAQVDDRLFWMANGKFMTYDGTVREIPCDVRDYVFGNLNLNERQKVLAGHNLKFSEVWWWYPSLSSTENDRYVVFNYLEGVWYFGSMSRTAWHPSGLTDYAVGAAPDGYLYEHETGMNDGSQNPPAAIHSYIESAPVNIGEGDKVFIMNRLIPDITFENSTGAPLATFTIKAKNFPGSAVGTNYLTSDVSRTATVPVEQFDQQKHLRLRGRAMSMRVETNDLNVRWRLGIPRIDIRTDGRR